MDRANHIFPIVSWPNELPWEGLVQYGLVAAVIVGLALGVVAIWRVERPFGRWRSALQARFLYGVPWGTLIVLGFVLAVYLFVQGGWAHWEDPVTIPFRAWSYLYPTGILTAGFAHNSTSHLINNLTGTLVLAPLAEYAFGHYPPNRMTRGRSLSIPVGTNRRVTDVPGGDYVDTPWIRAFVIFPGAAILIGLTSSLFAIGPVIGFSGVVFAFGGFALVHYPIATLVALLLTSVVRTIHQALVDPVVYAGITGAAPSPPGWATIAVQGHALGLLIGIVLGLIIVYRRGLRPPAAKLFLATLVYGTTRGLWAVYWYAGEDQFVLYRGLGVVLVLLLAVFVVFAVAASDRHLPLICRLPDQGPTRRQTALLVIILATAAISGPAVVANLNTVDEDPVPGTGEIEVEGYAITYEENVQNQLIPVIDHPLLANATDVTTSGAILVNEGRHIWSREISPARLADRGSARILIGGVGWRESVTVERSGYAVVGNSSVYAVDVEHDDRSVRSFNSPPSMADPKLVNHTFEFGVTEDNFEMTVYNQTEPVDTVPIPEANESVTVGEITIEAVENRRTSIYVEHDETRFRVAATEVY